MKTTTDYYDLGNHSLAITTSSPEGQLWFDRGLLQCYGFNHGEAVRCFRRALDADPGCAMAYWGVAYALGPYYNKAWSAFDEAEFKAVLAEAYEATMKALTLLDGVSELEQALIRSLQFRYPTAIPGAADTSAWVDQYAAEMLRVHRRFPHHSDVSTLAAEALITRTPWKLWDLKTGSIAKGASTDQAVEVLEAALERIEETGAPQHPGLLHLYIHTMEMSPNPEHALKAADRLRSLVPDAAHLLHMPSHIDVQCGQYQAAIDSNEAAIIADRKFVEREGSMNFYTLNRCHDYHFKVYGAMFLGSYRLAIEAAEEMNSTIPVELLRMKSPPMADWLESYVSTKQHVLIRFGRWDDIITQQLPEDRDLFCVTTAMMRYARAVAYATRGDLPSAQNEAVLFDEAALNVPASRYLFNNTCLDLLGVAREMMLGEIEYRLGHFKEAFAHLHKSVALDDGLLYDEPWGWMQPTRHALAALLLEQGQVEKAANIYRADLGLDGTLSRARQHPDNVWSLHGYHECLLRLGRISEAEIIGQRLKLASARTDIPITASCFCRLEA